MTLTEIERKELYAKAETYIDLEKDPRFRKEVKDIVEEHADGELNERFYTSLSFGTAGMRGIIGGGTQRINPFMVRKVTYGLGCYLKKFTSDPLVVIAFDSRNYSPQFALDAALTLCAQKIRVMKYDSLRPVPMLSFALRHLKADAGIVITASHNPAKYNGYKVYWSDGGQVTPPHDIGIANLISELLHENIPTIEQQKAMEEGLLSIVPQSVDEAYYDMVMKQIHRQDVIKKSSITISYTPLHGSGNIPVRTLFARLGVNCEVVTEQENPDGDFPTVSLPNPEDPQAMRLAIELAKSIKADIVLGTDPDADRLGIAIPVDEAKSTYRLLGGNQIAVLLCDYLMERYREEHVGDQKQPVVVKSLVTTDLVKDITEKHGGICIDVLTGFKYIAEQIATLENSKSQFFLFGCEESFGYLANNAVRDKDAVSTALLAVEMMAWYDQKHISIQNRLDIIYDEYGRYAESVLSFTYEGSSGRDRMNHIMQQFRSYTAGDSCFGQTIVKTADLTRGFENFPSSDVVILWLDSGEKIMIRPSGTEPKIKYYLFFHSWEKDLTVFEEQVTERIARIKMDL